MSDHQTTAECDLAEDAVDVDVIDLQLLMICRDEPLPKSKIVERASVGLNEKSVYHRVTRLADRGLLESQVCDGTRFEMKRQLIVAYKPSSLGEAVLERARVCRCDECEAVAAPEQHRHDWVEPVQYFEEDVAA